MAAPTNALKQATELAREFKSGASSPLDALQIAQAQLARLDPTLHILIGRRDPELVQADAQASAARWLAGSPLSALDGIPVAIKDNILTRDLPTSWGNPYLASVAGVRDEIAVARLRAAGLVIVGKTSVPEFTLEGYTANALVGVTGNPWATGLTPGGSSGGSVAGVASGCFPLALGTDGGGSIRRPAGYTGLVGLKPTIGRVPRSETLPPLLLDFEVIGPIGRTVSDVEALLNIIAGAHPMDRTSCGLPEAAHFAALSRTPMRRPRVHAVSRILDGPVDPMIETSFGTVCSRLETLGWDIRNTNLAVNVEPIIKAWPSIGQIGLSQLSESHPSAMRTANGKYRRWAEQAQSLPASHLLTVTDATRTLRQEVDVLFQDIDFILMPSAAAMPWPAHRTHPETIAGSPVDPRAHAIFTGWVNAAGLPALNIPGPASPDGMPIGFQLIGAWGSDRLLLEAAKEYEHAYPWHDLWPACAQAT